MFHYHAQYSEFESSFLRTIGRYINDNSHCHGVPAGVQFDAFSLYVRTVVAKDVASLITSNGGCTFEEFSCLMVVPKQILGDNGIVDMTISHHLSYL